MSKVRTVKVNTDGKTKVSQSSRPVGEILKSIYKQNGVQDGDIKDGVVDSTNRTWVEIQVRKSQKSISVEIV